MKKILLSIVMIVLLTLSACNSDDDNNNDKPVLQNRWTLINAQGGFSGTNQNFDSGKVVWTFKTDGTVVVANTDDSATPYMPFENGTYGYEVVPNPNSSTDYCKESININSSTFYCYSIDENNRLIIDSSPVDGFKYTFVRKN